jgi:hypothetical protein
MLHASLSGLQSFRYLVPINAINGAFVHYMDTEDMPTEVVGINQICIIYAKK